MARIYYTFLAGGLVIWPLPDLFVTSCDCAWGHLNECKYTWRLKISATQTLVRLRGLKKLETHGGGFCPYSQASAVFSQLLETLRVRGASPRVGVSLSLCSWGRP